MLGTIVNSLLIFAGGFGGIFFAKHLKENYKDIIMQAIPLVVMLVGISGAVKGINTEGASPVLFIISLSLGSVIGEALSIEKRLMDFGEVLQRKLATKNGESNFSKGFVTATLIFCIGTMAILGSIESGITGTHKILFAKGVIDCITAFILASTYGIGVMLSGVSVFIYQGSITLLSRVLSPIITENTITEISIVGGIMVFAIGINMLELKKIRVGNMLPAILIPLLVCSPFGMDIISKIIKIFQ